jgi:uncharacterized protein (TIGR02646 family)
MIRVERDQLDDNGNPIRPSESWFRRSAAATRRAIAEGSAHKVTALYRDDDLRKALEAVFRRKCAYCESRLGTVAPEEVEHYRPHGAVAESPDHPGYYWLAYTWTNLYPACTYCNQRRRDRPTWSEPVTEPPAGKGISFPLADESKRAMSPEKDLEQECPLLLDPCSPDIDPEEHFRYDVQGEIHPQSPWSVLAQATIRICHLRRRRLREDRARVISITVRIRQILATHELDRPATAVLQQMLDDQLHHSASHAGAARYVLRDPGAFPGALAGRLGTAPRR